MFTSRKVILASLIVCLSSALPTFDLVEELPQMPDLKFGLFSGYVPINGTSKQLHYVAALSQRDV